MVKDFGESFFGFTDILVDNFGNVDDVQGTSQFMGNDTGCECFSGSRRSVKERTQSSGRTHVFKTPVLVYGLGILCIIEYFVNRFACILAEDNIIQSKRGISIVCETFKLPAFRGAQGIGQHLTCKRCKGTSGTCHRGKDGFFDFKRRQTIA